MAKVFCEESSLSAVANAIRGKAGTAAALAFPDGFVSAVNGIETGGGTCTVRLTVTDDAISEPELVYVGAVDYGDGYARMSIGGADEVTDCIKHTLLIIPLDYASDLYVQVTGDGTYEYRIGSALLFYIYGDTEITVGPY